MQQLIDAFYRIRQIPYRIPLSLQEEDCCCSGKAKQLAAVCESLGVSWRYRVCEFLRSDCSLPQAILAIPHENLCTHVFLEILCNDERYCVDPTRDSGLAAVFPIAERDASSSTYFAVKPLQFYDLATSHRIMTGVNQDQEILDDLAVHGEFYEALNDWFFELRN